MTSTLSDAAATATHGEPLHGRRVLVTRAPHQASELADGLRALGAVPILIPTIEIGPPASFCGLDAALITLRTFDLVIFTSANAVHASRGRVRHLGLTVTPRRIAAVGPATAAALAEVGMVTDVLPPVYTAESLGALLAPTVAGQHILILRPDDAPSALLEALVAAGAIVTVASAYANRIPKESIAALRALFSTALFHPDAVTFTSASTATNLVALLEAAGLKLPGGVLRASIGPITTRTLNALGLAPHMEAAKATVASLIDALVLHFTGEWTPPIDGEGK